MQPARATIDPDLDRQTTFPSLSRLEGALHVHPPLRRRHLFRAHEGRRRHGLADSSLARSAGCRCDVEPDGRTPIPERNGDSVAASSRWTFAALNRKRSRWRVRRDSVGVCLACRTTSASNQRTRLAGGRSTRIDSPATRIAPLDSLSAAALVPCGVVSLK